MCMYTVLQYSYYKTVCFSKVYYGHSSYSHLVEARCKIFAGLQSIPVWALNEQFPLPSCSIGEIEDRFSSSTDGDDVWCGCVPGRGVRMDGWWDDGWVSWWLGHHSLASQTHAYLAWVWLARLESPWMWFAVWIPVGYVQWSHMVQTGRLTWCHWSRTYWMPPLPAPSPVSGSPRRKWHLVSDQNDKVPNCSSGILVSPGCCWDFGCIHLSFFMASARASTWPGSRSLSFAGYDLQVHSLCSWQASVLTKEPNCQWKAAPECVLLSLCVCVHGHARGWWWWSFAWVHALEEEVHGYHFQGLRGDL